MKFLRRLIITMVIALPFAGGILDRSAAAVDSIAVCYPGPAPFYIALAVARPEINSASELKDKIIGSGGVAGSH